MDRSRLIATFALAGACFNPAEPDAACFDDDECKDGRICADRQCVAPDINMQADTGNVSEESGEDSDVTEDGSGSAADGEGSSMDECAAAGQSCEVPNDCCDFGTQSAGCIQLDSGSVCSDACEANAGCASGCCLPFLAGEDASGYAGCVPADYCQTTECGGAQCDYDWCDSLPGDCPPSFFGDGSCDCGCQFFDVDCQ